MDTAPFWRQAQPGFRFTDAEPGTPRFYAEVERHRYALEPHIPDVVRFEEWAGKEVLEVGCGVGTDGTRFARAGARYTGSDQTVLAIELAARRFALEGLYGSFQAADAAELPFADESFDLVFSHGVLHHIPDTDAAVQELHRVLRPGGVALVMVYHRRSLNYLFNILVVRRALAATLILPGLPRVLARLTGSEAALLAGHAELLRRHGRRYLTDTALFLSNNTDGPNNPLSNVYSSRQAKALFDRAGFTDIQTQTRYLNLRLYPRGDRLADTTIARRLERRIGWHLYVRARKRHRGEPASGGVR